VDRPVPPELPGYLGPFPDDLAEIVHLLRERIFGVMPNAHEVVWDAANAVSLVYAPSRRWQDGVCHIAVYSEHVNLGFNHGAALPDPWDVLRGTGKRIRHATFRNVEEVDVLWIDQYLQAALSHAGGAPDMGDGGTTVRVSSGIKRRPRGSADAT
jgi:hypothetical protein